MFGRIWRQQAFGPWETSCFVRDSVSLLLLVSPGVLPPWLDLRLCGQETAFLLDHPTCQHVLFMMTPESCVLLCCPLQCLPFPLWFDWAFFLNLLQGLSIFSKNQLFVSFIFSLHYIYFCSNMYVFTSANFEAFFSLGFLGYNINNLGSFSFVNVGIHF